MSDDRLNRDQVAALVEAAKQGQLPEQPSGVSQRRGHRLRTVDFSRPTKFTADHQRRITRAIDTFCQTSVTRLSTELRTAIELETINTTQATWSGAQAQLPAGSLCGHARGTADRNPDAVHGRAVVHPHVPGLPARRHARRAPARAALQRDRRDAHPAPDRVDGPPLSLVWQDLAGVSLSIVEIETYNDASQIAAVSEPTLVVMIESRIEQAFGLDGAAHPVDRDRSGGRAAVGKEPARPRPTGARDRTRRPASPVTLRAEVAAVELPDRRDPGPRAPAA